MTILNNKLLISILLSCCFSNCTKFEYNANQINRLEDDETVTTQYNIDRLLKLPHKDTLHIVFFGDTQRYYDDFEDLVDALDNLPKLDAVIVTGDIVDFGLEREYSLINEQFKKIKVPFVTVVGNHDLVANASKLYQKIYGPLNYSFTWNDIRFIAHNTNGREYGFNGNVPDLNWMQQQVIDTNNYVGCIFYSHVPPFNPDFDASLNDGYTQLISNAKNTLFSINGHRHGIGLDYYTTDSILYINTSSPKNRYYSYITIYPHATATKKFDYAFVAF